GRCQAVRQAMEEGEPLRPELVYRLAKEGDADCARIVRDVGRYIGIAAANMINVFAPNRLVLCGAIDTADELILDAVRSQIEQHALPKLREQLQVGLAAAKERSPLLGAAVLVARDLFELPKLRHIGQGVAEESESPAESELSAAESSP
ncbi:MAG TPA: ROK family protein, partial [Phycisphaeraceae bacterium]